MKYNESNVAQELFNADAPYIYDGKGNYVFSARSLAILFNKIVNDNTEKAPEPIQIKVGIEKMPKMVDWGKAGALKKAGWSNKAIAEELKIEERLVKNYFEARKAHLGG